MGNSRSRGGSNAIRRWICLARAQEESEGLSPPGADGRENVAEARCARLQGMRRRRPQSEVGNSVFANDEVEARRDRGVLLYRVQVAEIGRASGRERWR